MEFKKHCNNRTKPEIFYKQEIEIVRFKTIKYKQETEIHVQRSIQFLNNNSKQNRNLIQIYEQEAWEFKI